MISFDAASLKATILQVRNLKVAEQDAARLSTKRAGGVFRDAVRQNISLRDHGPEDLARLDHPYARRHGGIHFQDGDLWGREMGAEIGPQAFALAQAYWTGDSEATVESAGSVCVPGENTLCVAERFRMLERLVRATLGETTD